MPKGSDTHMQTPNCTAHERTAQQPGLCSLSFYSVPSRGYSYKAVHLFFLSLDTGETHGQCQR
eukprot:1161063-Pelagomonas_calceolata.AAC.2